MNDSHGRCVLQSKYGSNCADKEGPARHERFTRGVEMENQLDKRCGYSRTRLRNSLRATPQEFRVAVGSVMPQLVTHTRKGDLHALR